MRQAHHWAADVFVAAMVLHLLRVFFTGAFRRPREVVLGPRRALCSAPVIFEGFAGYSLPDDLMSGMGLGDRVRGRPVAPARRRRGVRGRVGRPVPRLGERSRAGLFIAHVFIVPASYGRC